MTMHEVLQQCIHTYFTMSSKQLRQSLEPSLVCTGSLNSSSQWGQLRPDLTMLESAGVAAYPGIVSRGSAAADHAQSVMFNVAHLRSSCKHFRHRYSWLVATITAAKGNYCFKYHRYGDSPGKAPSASRACGAQYRYTLQVFEVASPDPTHLVWGSRSHASHPTRALIDVRLNVHNSEWIKADYASVTLGMRNQNYWSYEVPKLFKMRIFLIHWNTYSQQSISQTA